MAFPFTCLPSVVTEYVVKLMDLSDQVALSVTSLKSKAVVRRISKRKESHMTLHVVGEKFMMTLESRGKSANFAVECSNPGIRAINDMKLMNGSSISIDIDWQTLISYWEEEELGILSLYDYLSEVFSIKTVSYVFKHQTSPYLFKVFSLERKIETNRISFIGSMIHVPMTFLLHRCKTHISNIDIQSGSFNLEHLNYEKLNIDNLFVEFSRSVSVEHLPKAMNCVSVKLNAIEINSAELNEFIKEWLDGDSRMKYMELNAVDGQLNLAEIVRGLNVVKKSHVINENGVIRQFHDNECYLLHRKDEVMATVRCTGNHFILNALAV